MSTANDTNTNLVCILSVTSLLYTVHHAYKFDGCRCLLPRKKEWFRALLTWMLLICELGMLIWGAGWAYVKYHLGWTYIPEKGAIPVPTQLYSDHFKSFNNPLTIWVCISFSLHVSLNAEEGLYWYHLMRALHRPRSGKSWFRSPFFFSWLGISLIAPIAIICAGWINFKDMDTQMGRMFVVAGGIEALVCLAASTVVFKFPQFLRHVKQSGADPEVRSRLHFYHQANKVRTFFRALFTTCILILGIDSLTKDKIINVNHIASDLLHQISFGAYFFANIISVMVYLPRDYNTAPIPLQQHVMIGQPYSPNNNKGPNINSEAFKYPASSPANLHRTSQTLMSLLREGGQWDEDDDLKLALFNHNIEEFPVHLKDKVSQWIEEKDEEQGLDVDGDGRRVRRLTPLQNWSVLFGIPQNKPKSKSPLRPILEIEVQQNTTVNVSPSPRSGTRI
ncbi:uncharacterized protein L201_001801 [Kwoniella dendrophila CBS 6074]|uniref:Uncharacterized protein n=1 Tax=Kwoniella dendrophila CBS 6074 TaxID=1295534 RepID=A0AAX4JQ09_9TREE